MIWSWGGVGRGRLGRVRCILYEGLPVWRGLLAAASTALGWDHGASPVVHAGGVCWWVWTGPTAGKGRRDVHRPYISFLDGAAAPIPTALAPQAPPTLLPLVRNHQWLPVSSNSGSGQKALGGQAEWHVSGLLWRSETIGSEPRELLSWYLWYFEQKLQKGTSPPHPAPTCPFDRIITIIHIETVLYF